MDQLQTDEQVEQHSGHTIIRSPKQDADPHIKLHPLGTDFISYMGHPS